ncbi:hypothetical protein [Chitinophaga pinensis]|uniref:Uncharacterized protein n=1 Tax=Chitinophaga pinensis (strain ATCC 43595 / DSM 2588 / LMG 13176 / NBRC 15968 / NCIMB 11800 / UQM 2034) TaxID=485918 RepID=A0A979G609_CHIPD|nr:hypothetical protein [Chitinophaga pinensis]ACU61515.1 hypothetical protein Cpin_4055 [Chitinophaga pinensis DSM 2588]
MAYERFWEKKASKSGRSVADNITAGAKALPAVNPLLNLSAAPGSPVQRYVAGGDGRRWPLTRTSEDGRMQVVGKGTGNKLYAEQDLIVSASAALAAAKADIRLVAGTTTKSVVNPATNKRKHLPDVEVRKAKDQGEEFSHEGSCIDEALAIMDTNKQKGLSGRFSGKLYKAVLAHLFQQRGVQDYDGDIDRIEKKDNKREKSVDKLDGDYDYFRDLLYEVVYNAPRWLPDDWREVRTALAGADTLTMDLFWTRLLRLSRRKSATMPDALTEKNVRIFNNLIDNQLGVRDLLATHNAGRDENVAGVNEMANPKVGGSFLILSGGRNVQKKLTWNFHWGAAAMKSGSDIVTIESYANNEDAKGQWDMYGTAKKEQTFHAEHAGSNMHGHSPVTVGTWAGPKGKLNIGSE